MSIAHAMTPQPVSCRGSDSIASAARLMENYAIGFLPVLDGDGHLAGVITDRDIVCRGLAASRPPETTPVADCMSAPAVTMALDGGLAGCIALMTAKRVSRVLVVDDRGGCCGVVSLADIAAVAADPAVAALARALGHAAERAAGA